MGTLRSGVASLWAMGPGFALWTRFALGDGVGL